ncbi:MAG: mononuclear molybdenum enzyme YedY, partial [Moraxellaceae bacterium]|nr:mononuclear molybdenum enzyme YedY [Moraxellaceae bacterium]
MLIRQRSASEPLLSEVASESVYQQRRELIKAAGLLGAAALLP